MNRQQRRAARKAGSAAAGPDPILLKGGPMDGWLVNGGAPALRDDWWTTWPDDIASRWRPGAYRMASRSSEGTRVARWRQT